MLDRNQLFQQISNLTAKIFPETYTQNNLAQKEWAKISADIFFKNKVDESKSSFLVPKWHGNLTDTFKIDTDLNEYSILAVDGSQIYPDRHLSGAKCFLINLGGCGIQYGNVTPQNKVKLFSYPLVFIPEDLFPEEDSIIFSTDIVDLKREELELQILFDKSLESQKETKPQVSLLDGSLIFWNLEGKQTEIKEHFLKRYLNQLNKFYENNILIAGYISLPKSRELVNLIKIGLCRLDHADCISCHSKFKDFPCKQVDNLIDSNIARFLLNTFERTTIFYSTSKITDDYPDDLKPCFFYLNIGYEIIRIETLSWIADDPEYINLICKAAIDQSIKGNGYPVVLAESHEQAVVKGPDRDFFYHLIQKIGIDQKKEFIISRKNLKKRGIGI